MDDLKNQCQALIDYYAKRNQVFKAMDNFFNSKWDLPEALSKLTYIRKTVSSDPHDALRAATQILSTVEPHFQILPPLDDMEIKIYIDEVETYLRYIYSQAERRNQITSDVVRCLLQYGMVAVQTANIHYQQKIKPTFSPSRLRAAMQHGAFTALVRKPHDVYPVISEYGLESVLLTKVYNMREFSKFWGKFDFINPDDDTMEYVMVYDYTDYERRVVWATQSATTDVIAGIDGQTILETENDLGFIPWVIKTVGPAYCDKPEERLNPLLKPVLDTDLWGTQNVLLTLLTSETIARAASPRIKIQGPGANDVDVDYGDPNKPITSETPPSMQSIEPMQPPMMDQAMVSNLELISSAIGKQTVARFIQNPEMKADVPFSSMNLIFQLGANTINPHKMVAQEAIAEIGRQFLLWTKLNDEEQWVPKKIKKENGETTGTMIMIDPQLIDPDYNIQVELTADVPTDRMQKINAASIAVQTLKMPIRRALEQIGISDPEQAIREREAERVAENEVEITMKERQAESEMNMQAKMMQMQMMQQQLQQPVPQQQADPFGNLGGQGFNPAMGGSPPAMGAPEMTREQVSGQTKAGDDMGMM